MYTNLLVPVSAVDFIFKGCCLMRSSSKSSRLYVGSPQGRPQEPCTMISSYQSLHLTSPHNAFVLPRSHLQTSRFALGIILVVPKNDLRSHVHRSARTSLDLISQCFCLTWSNLQTSFLSLIVVINCKLFVIILLMKQYLSIILVVPKNDLGGHVHWRANSRLGT